VPSRSILPAAEGMFTNMFFGGRKDILERPPWGCVATPELAIDYLYRPDELVTDRSDV
jgi:hypothetical protein